jgi:hypothetical protein
LPDSGAPSVNAYGTVAVIAVVDGSVFPDGDRDLHRGAVDLGRHLHPLEHVVPGHAQLDDPRA